MRFIRSFLTCAGLLAAACVLTGCGTAPRHSDTAGTASGITVYGTADAGVGRVAR